MIIFDYGQTLVNEKPFNGLLGTEAVLKEATNDFNYDSIDRIQSLADDLNKEIGRYGGDPTSHTILEVHNHIFQNYLYDYFGIELTKSKEEVEQIFEKAASSAEPTKNVNEFLQFLDNKNIRTGVISNISFSGKILYDRINRYIPFHKFEFIIASSEYIFRKPHKRIFELALRKANLEPDDVWYCGDNAVFDIDGAAACGIFPIWYKGAIEKANSFKPKSEFLEINDWLELVKVLS